MEIDDLSKQIIAKYEEIKESDETYSVKIELWIILKEIIERLFPKANLVSFGSTATRLCMEGSDADFVILLDSEKLTHMRKIEILEIVEGYIGSLAAPLGSIFTNVELLSSCMVPLLKLKTTLLTRKFGQYVEVEISVSTTGLNYNQTKCELGNEMQNGTRNTHLLICYTKLFQKHQFPILNILTIVIKYWASKHSLLGNFYHGLSGYGILLMVIFYLQQVNILPCLQESHPNLFPSYEPVLKGSFYNLHKQEAVMKTLQFQNNLNLGKVLTNFFEYYANFDYDFVISVRSGKLLRKWDCADYADTRISRESAREWFKEILIEDPIYRYNVARATNDIYMARKIIKTFMKSGNILKNCNNLQDIFTFTSVL